MEKIRHFEELFRRNYARFYQSAFRLTRNMAMAEDIVQEVFMKYWYDEQGTSIRVPESYLYQAVVNRALNVVSTQKRREEHLSHYGRQQSLAANSVEQTVRFGELQQQLQQALESLPPVCRKVFLLSRYEDLSHREIADVLHISPNTVDNHIKKALNILRHALLSLCVIFLPSQKAQAAPVRSAGHPVELFSDVVAVRELSLV